MKPISLMTGLIVYGTRQFAQSAEFRFKAVNLSPTADNVSLYLGSAPLVIDKSLLPLVQCMYTLARKANVQYPPTLSSIVEDVCVQGYNSIRRERPWKEETLKPNQWIFYGKQDTDEFKLCHSDGWGLAKETISKAEPTAAFLLRLDAEKGKPCHWKWDHLRGLNAVMCDHYNICFTLHEFLAQVFNIGRRLARATV